MVAMSTVTLLPDNATMQYKCMAGYAMYGDDMVSCNDGVWGTNLPQCIMHYEQHAVRNRVNMIYTVLQSEST